MVIKWKKTVIITKIDKSKEKKLIKILKEFNYILQGEYMKKNNVEKPIISEKNGFPVLITVIE